MGLAIFFALSAAVGWGISGVLARLGLQHMRATTGTVISLASGTALVGAIALAMYGRELFSFSLTALLWFTLLGIINYPLGRLLNFTGVHLAGVSRATPILSTSPLISAALGIMVGGETMNIFIGLGTAAIIGGVLLIVTQRA